MTVDLSRLVAYRALLARPDDLDTLRRHRITQPLDLNAEQRAILRLEVMWRGLVSRGLWDEHEEHA